MNMPKLFLILAVTWFVYSIVNAGAGFEKPLRKSLYSILFGLGSLVLVHCISPFTGVSVPISVMSITVSSVMGIPGTTLLLLLNMFF